MTSQNIQFLTVSEAQEMTGKSQSTINRIINKYKGSKHIKSDGNKHLVSSKLLSELVKNYSMTSHLTSQSDSMTSLLEAKNETIEILKQTVNNQANQINELIQRNRESNIIIKSLQEQIKLPEKAQTITTVDIKSARHTNTPLIMNLYSQGMTYSKIAEQLNNQGLKNQYGKEYTRDAIKTTVNRNK